MLLPKWGVGTHPGGALGSWAWCMHTHMAQIPTSPPLSNTLLVDFFEKCLGAEYPLGGGRGGEAWFGISPSRFELLYQTPSSTMCNIREGVSSFRVCISVCVHLGISVVVEAGGGGGVAYNNCLANALDDFFSSHFSLSLPLACMM